MITSNIDIGPEYSNLKGSLDDLLSDPTHCFAGRVSGESMVNAGIYPGSVLIVNRKLNAEHMDIIVCLYNGQFICKYFDKKKNQLISANEDHPPVKITEHDEFSLEGIVTSSINFFRPSSEWDHM